MRSSLHCPIVEVWVGLTQKDYYAEMLKVAGSITASAAPKAMVVEPIEVVC